MAIWFEYGIVFMLVALSAYYVWTRVLFKNKVKKSAGCGSGCGKCG